MSRRSVVVITVLVFLLAVSSVFGFLMWKHKDDHNVTAPSPSETAATPHVSESPQEPVTFSNSFPREWNGYYEGESKYTESGKLGVGVRLAFSDVQDNGTVSGTAYIQTPTTAPVERHGSYTFTGTIDQEKSSVQLNGNAWIDKGNLTTMRDFSGSLSSDMDTITGVAVADTDSGYWVVEAH
ncbi:MAG: hypothetical protein IKS49_07490 [Actinomycetaceae bacterium]|nr:hypothetical protein [Actinomycetaceae bacterium]